MRLAPITAAGLLLTAAGLAQAQGVDLSWTAPGGCPSQAEIMAAVQAQVRAPAAEPIAALGVVTPDRGRFRLRLTTDQGGRRGERTLEAGTCRELGEAAAAILAWMIAPENAAPAEPDVVAAPPVTWSVGTMVAADLGTLPGLAAGYSLQTARSGDRWGLRLAAAHWPRRTGEVDPGRGGKFSLLTLALAGCYRVWGPAWVCAGPEGTRLSGRGFGVDQPAERSVSWIAGAAGVTLTIPLWRALGLVARVEGVLPLRRERFALEGAGTIYRVAPAGRAYLGAAAAF